jgi:hypothetical protein
MEVRVINGAQRYANIKTDSVNMDVQIARDKPIDESLRDRAQEIRRQAQQLISRADLMDRAADVYAGKAH